MTISDEQAVAKILRRFEDDVPSVKQSLRPDEDRLLIRYIRALRAISRGGVKEAVTQYLGAMAEAHAVAETSPGYVEKGSYFSTLDNLPDFVATALSALDQEQESAKPFCWMSPHEVQEIAIPASPARDTRVWRQPTNKEGESLIPLFLSPSVCKGKVTEEMIERAARIVDPTLWSLFADQQDRTGESMEAQASRSGRWAAAKETARAALTAALSQEGE